MTYANVIFPVPAGGAVQVKLMFALSFLVVCVTPLSDGICSGSNSVSTYTVKDPEPSTILKKY